MGLFGKIKNILFEEEEEETADSSMPVFTKDNQPSDEKESFLKEEEPEKEEEEPIKINSGSRFRNFKRDIDLSFDEKDVLDEVVSNVSNKAEEPKKEEKEENVVKEVKKSPFLPFDEDEFDRLNSRSRRNVEKEQEKEKEKEKELEHKIKMVNEEHKVSNLEARKANNNFSSTTPNKDLLDKNFDNNKFNGKKPFRPSPVISPVYGILDKNYTKEEIVSQSKENVIERVHVEKKKVEINEKKEKPEDVIKNHENKKSVDLDYVRKKAFGVLEDGILETEKENNLEDEDLFNEKTRAIKLDFRDEDLKKDNDMESVVEVQEITEIDDLPQKVKEDDESLSELILNDMDSKEEKAKEKRAPLEDVEKTSTLQILDDIEKELNSIKPISSRINEDGVSEDTLENDLFNLIDSMYEEGDENDG